MTDLRKAAEMALKALDSCSEEEDYDGEWFNSYDEDLVIDAREALRQALAQPEQEPTPLCWGFESLGHAMFGEGEPFCPSGQKVSLSSMKPGDRFVLVRTGQIYSIKNNGAVWNETEQRAARLHKNCQVEPIVTHPKCDAACLNICTEGFSKPPNCIAPPKREWVGLTEDEINNTRVRWTMINGPGDYLLPFARAIEAKLKEKNNA